MRGRHARQGEINSWLIEKPTSRRALLGLILGATAAGACGGLAAYRFIEGEFFPGEPNLKLLNTKYEDRPEVTNLPYVTFKGDIYAQGEPQTKWGQIAIVGMTIFDAQAANERGWRPAAVKWVPDGLVKQPTGRSPRVADLGSWKNVAQAGQDDMVGIAFPLGPDGLKVGIAGIDQNNNVVASWQLHDMGIHTVEDMEKSFPNVGIA